MNKTIRIISAIICGCFLGCVSVPRALIEPQSSPCNLPRAAKTANQTLAVPCIFKMQDTDIPCVVKQTDWIGDAVGAAIFSSGGIVASEFNKVFNSNFRVANSDEAPVAEFHVGIIRSTARKLDYSDVVESILQVRIEVVKSDGSEKCYSKVFSKTAAEAWTDRNTVPQSFYRALEGVINDFLIDWGGSGAVTMLDKWRNALKPSKIKPALESISWSQQANVWIGECEVTCNEYEGFEAKTWAVANIAVACRTKLGNIEPERVRVVYDDEKYDKKSRKWKFVFRTFPRIQMALSFNPVTKSGIITGDLELISAVTNEDAVAKMKEYVFREMESHCRLLYNSSKRYQVRIRFDDFETDKTFNLITIKFRLID